MAQSPQGRYETALRQALRCQGLSHEVTEAEAEANTSKQEVAISFPEPAKVSSSAPRTGCSFRNPANRLWIKSNQCEIFVRQLKVWASNHDSSAHFNGSISLQPQGSVSGEVVELGRSVKCLLIDATSTGPPKQIIIRLYQSHRSRNNVVKSQNKEAPTSCSTRRDASRKQSRETIQAYLLEQDPPSSPSYHMVIRSASGWVNAREYFDKHHFHSCAKAAKAAHAQSLARARALNELQQRTDTLLSGLNSRQHAPVTQSIAQISTALSQTNAVLRTSNNAQANDQRAHDGGAHWISAKKIQVNPKPIKSSVSVKDQIRISPLFRSFTRLPHELQDQILYHAIGYTKKIKIDSHRTVNIKNASLSAKSSTSISKLFRISKEINKHMVPHILRSTNFQFGMTGFTNFLWQIGPVNRSYLQNLTFNFGRASLLHCVRWLAPDPLWELFEPPVATNPPSLTYFWRCQIQDLMRELSLLTLTVDIRDVPLADVPMLVRILKSAIGSTEHVRIIDNLGSKKEPKVVNLALLRRFPDFEELTWKELALRYHADYKHLRWHMRHKLVPTDPRVDLRSLLGEWMDKTRAFFDG